MSGCVIARKSPDCGCEIDLTATDPLIFKEPMINRGGVWRMDFVPDARGYSRDLPEVSLGTGAQRMAEVSLFERTSESRRQTAAE